MLSKPSTPERKPEHNRSRSPEKKPARTANLSIKDRGEIREKFATFVNAFLVSFCWLYLQWNEKAWDTYWHKLENHVFSYKTIFTPTPCLFFLNWSVSTLAHKKLHYALKGRDEYSIVLYVFISILNIHANYYKHYPMMFDSKHCPVAIPTLIAWIKDKTARFSTLVFSFIWFCVFVL